MRYDTAVWNSTDLTSTETLVALAWAFPSYEVGAKSDHSFATIAERAKVTRGTVIKATKSLVDKGWLKLVSKQEFKPSVYLTKVP